MNEDPSEDFTVREMAQLQGWLARAEFLLERLRDEVSSDDREGCKKAHSMLESELQLLYQKEYGLYRGE